MIKEFCFPTMPNFVEICKQLGSLDFINVKLKSKQSFKWKPRVCNLLRISEKLHACCSVAICSGVPCQDCFKCQFGRLKLQITKVSSLFSICVVCFLTFEQLSLPLLTL